MERSLYTAARFTASKQYSYIVFNAQSATPRREMSNVTDAVILGKTIYFFIFKTDGKKCNENYVCRFGFFDVRKVFHLTEKAIAAILYRIALCDDSSYGVHFSNMM